MTGPAFRLGGVLRGINREFEAQLEDLGGANDPELKEAAKLLRDSIKRTLGRRSKKVAAPGEAPKSKTGQLARSVVEGPVGPARRVAVLAFYGPILEDKDHPFMEQSLEAVEDQMTDVIVSGFNRRLPE